MPFDIKDLRAGCFAGYQSAEQVYNRCWKGSGLLNFTDKDNCGNFKRRRLSAEKKAYNTRWLLANCLHT